MGPSGGYNSDPLTSLESAHRSGLKDCHLCQQQLGRCSG